MNSIDMKQHVQKAIESEWPAFAANHPNLAAAIDQTLLIEQATASLMDDSEYQQALANADASGAAAEVVKGLVVRFVGRWLGKFI